MTTFSSLALWSIVAVCPLARALTLNLYNVTSPGSMSQDSQEPTVGADADTHCTKDPDWLIPAFPSIHSYDLMCQAAMAKAIRDLTLYGLDTDFELLAQGSIAQTRRPKIRLPRRYVASKYREVTKRKPA